MLDFKLTDFDKLCQQSTAKEPVNRLGEETSPINQLLKMKDNCLKEISRLKKVYSASKITGCYVSPPVIGGGLAYLVGAATRGDFNSLERFVEYANSPSFFGTLGVIVGGSIVCGISLHAMNAIEQKMVDLDWNLSDINSDINSHEKSSTPKDELPVNELEASTELKEDVSGEEVMLEEVVPETVAPEEVAQEEERVPSEGSTPSGDAMLGEDAINSEGTKIKEEAPKDFSAFIKNDMQVNPPELDDFCQ